MPRAWKLICKRTNPRLHPQRGRARQTVELAEPRPRTFRRTAQTNMAKVKFLDQDLVVEVPVGTSILQASKKIGAPEGDACGGVCACSTCHVYVEEGAELLTEAEEDEEDILDKAFDVR